jgi:hypothetical protein
MRNPKTKNLLLLVAIVLLLLGGWYLWGPSGGGLISLNEDNFAEFTGQFDRAVSDERVLVLASPT